MMIDKRLIGTVSGSMKYIIGNVIFQWCSLLANILMMTGITRFLAGLFADGANEALWSAGQATIAVILAAIAVRFVCTLGASRMSFLSSKAVKRTLRAQIYEKLLRLGASYHEQVQTSEVVQVAVEGVDQLETYFGAYLPQFFYAMLAPLTLFVYLCTFNVPSAIVLLVCVPLIPVAIAAVQTWAKKLLSKYWGQYTALGDTFLENLQGLTTLKIYQADEFKQQEMNEEAEKFRRITMKVLTMQLNSITIMDFIAYGGAALGIIMAATQYRAGHVSLAGCLLIILLGADFFLPMRQLGSYFHIAMNGMAASDKIFRLLDLPEAEQKTAERMETPSHIAKGEPPADGTIVLRELRFSYHTESAVPAAKDESDKASVYAAKDERDNASVYAAKNPTDRSADATITNDTQDHTSDREVLHGVNMEFPSGSFISIVGESGCGKSTIASILMGRNRNYQGSVTIRKGISDEGEPGMELREIREANLMESITYVSHQSYLFKGTIRDNLLMGDPDASDERLWEVLEQVKLADFLRGNASSAQADPASKRPTKTENTADGLDIRLTEQGGNLSGGQRQRLALARALLHDSPIYIFDEATSNIDVESENDIMAQIHALAKRKTVILISHRLANVTNSDRIYVMDAGVVVEEGKHEALLAKDCCYAALWRAQQSLEKYGTAYENTLREENIPREVGNAPRQEQTSGKDGE
ncbi:MAG: ATP-binding cassette domain-containing protein [Lachnospiraceae bacterium]|nr:ATP-binding cassette domain-containing protein [Lachnospiraceae bacterium]